MVRFGALGTLLCFLSSCGPAQVLDLSPQEAAERLKQGETDFILQAPPERLGELGRLHPGAPFYAGLLVRETGAEDAASRGALLFKAALENSRAPSSRNPAAPRIRAAAAGELILPLLEGDISPEQVLAAVPDKKGPELLPLERSLKGAVLYRLGRGKELAALSGPEESGTSWDRALRALGGGETGALSSFFLNGPPEKAYRWALGEAERTGAALSGAERAAAAGRLAAARSSYGEALRLFRIVLEEEPGLFTRYPDLTADLGRTFQFAGAGEEGLTRFLAWEEGLEDAEEPGPLPYLLLYYAGRMARSLGRHTQGTALFTQALAAAPDQVQKDACIWYILSGTLISRPGNAAARFKEYLPHWYDDRYFADLLDQLSRYLTAQRQWKTLGELFSLIRFKNDGASTARFAWILGRAVEEGYLSPAEGASILGKGGIDRGETARAFFTLAFEESSTSFYYRVLSASRLGNLGGLVVAAGSSANETLPPKPPLALPPGGLLPENAPSGHEAEAVKTPGAGLGIFLGGFFSYGAGAFAASYLEEIMDDLSLSELREAAEVFAKAGEWRESIRLAAACMARPDYELSRRDLELNYPRPYRELIEENAAAASLAPAILYGLVRTESNFTPEILSRAGAVGLTQLMDATAREMAGRIARQGGPDYLSAGELDLTGPAVNLHIGAYYLNYLIGRMGSPLLALLAYNGGMGRVRRWRAAEPSLPEDLFLETIEYPETRDYGRRVLAAAAAYGYLYYGMSMEALIADIFKGTPKK